MGSEKEEDVDIYSKTIDTEIMGAQGFLVDRPEESLRLCPQNCHVAGSQEARFS